MQVQIQDSEHTNIRLLHDLPDPAVAPEPELADLARQVNEFLEAKAKDLLRAKRAAAGNDRDRVEFTVLLTDNGLQLAYVYGLKEKEVAPTPRKPLWRSLLGPLAVRRYWRMPAHHTEAKPPRTIRWPIAFWLIVLAVVAVLVFARDNLIAA